MRRRYALPLLLLLALFLPTGLLHSQPHTYLIPDVGAPGMSVYVEVIATADSIGKFLYADGPADPTTLFIRLRNPADSARLRISPGIVSWDNRFIGFQFFVKPGAATGPIPLELSVSGTRMSLDTFWIQNVQPFGSKSGGGVIGSGGVWGTRSRRGAMIVDSMILGPGTYSVSTADPDNGRLGNQGYLPAVIISRGRVSIAAGATIHVNATGIDGGPGGGGGGGYGPSAVFPRLGERDADALQRLGNGFAAGRSSVPLVPSPGPFGTGTGDNPSPFAPANDQSHSLNNVSASATFSASRLYAAGPGHPFDRDGRSGGAGAVGVGAPPSFGLYFGGGGNATSGSGLPGAAPATVNGQAIGNSMIMPLHGGAGGASGGTNDSIGGGGGGGLSIHSGLRATIARAQANGANGRAGCAGCGAGSGDPSGGGAGGSIIVGGRLGVTLTTIDVAGGTAGPTSGSSWAGNGGVGRFRNDGRLAGGPTVSFGASRYAGPTLDTLSWADTASWTIRGSGRYTPGVGGDSILIFVRGENSPWNYSNPTKVTVRSDSTWSARITFPFDTLAYIYVAQQADTTGSTEYAKIPRLVYSQSAAAIVRLELLSKLEAPTGRGPDTIICDAPHLDTLIIRNRGTGLLVLGSGSRFVGPNRTYYSIISPALPDTTLPNDTTHVIVRFNAPAAPDGDRSDTLMLVTNDAANANYRIPFQRRREARKYSIIPRTIDFGRRQRLASVDTTILFVNRSTYPVLISNVTLASVQGGGTYEQTPSVGSPTVAPGDTVRIMVRFTPTDTTASSASFEIRSFPCGTRDTIFIRGTGGTGIIDSRKLLRFGELACADTAVDSVWVHNIGTYPLTVEYPEIWGFDSLRFSVISPPNVGFPRSLAPDDSILFRIRVDASTGGGGLLQAKLRILNSDSTYRKNPYFVDLTADRAAAVLEVDTLVDLGTLCVGRSSLHQIVMNNLSSGAVISVQSIALADTGGTITVAAPKASALPLELAAGTYDNLTLRVLPTATGPQEAIITLRTSPCDNVVRIRVRYTADNSGLTFTPNPIAFGDVGVGTTGRRTIVVANTNPVGGAVTRIERLELRPTNPQVTLRTPVPPARTLQPGDTMHVILEYRPSGESKLPTMQLCAMISAPCLDTLCVDVSGNGIRSAVGVSRNDLTLSLPLCSPPPFVEDTLSIFNTGSGAVTVQSITPAPGVFTLISPTNPFVLSAGGAQSVRVRFTPTVPGTVNGTLTFRTSDPDRPTFDVDLVGRQDTQALVPSSRVLDFGSILACQGDQLDTVVLRNTGTARLTINRINTLPAAAFLIGQAPPFVISAGDSLRLPVIFSPSSDGPFQALLTYQVDSCGPADTIELRGTRVAPSQPVTPLDFGDVMRGSSGGASVTITNNNPVGIRIVGARFSPASAELVVNAGQFPIIVPAGGSAVISTTFSPTIPGDISAGTELLVDIDSVCTLVGRTTVSGRGIEGGIAASTRALDFGARLFCRDSVDSVTFRNVGNEPTTITTVGITPAAGSPFVVTGGSMTPPRILAPGDSATVVVTYDAALLPDGPFAAMLTLETDDPLRPTIEVDLAGVRQSQSALLLGPGFAGSAAGSVVQRTHRLVNNGTAPLDLTSLTGSAPWRVVTTTPSLPRLLMPGDTLLVELEFAPSTPGDFTDSLVLALTSSCGVVSVPVSETAIDLSVIDGLASWGSVTGKPGDLVRIPLTITTDFDGLGVRSFTASASYNPSILYPVGVALDGTVAAGWSVSAFNVTRGQVAFTVEGSSPLSGTGTLVWLEARVALGDSVATFVRGGDTASTTSPRAALTIGDGLFSLDALCLIGPTRLVSADGGFGVKSVRPNPLTGSGEIEIAIVEEGRTQLALVDALGRRTLPLLDTRLAPGSYVVAVSTRSLPSGLYYLELLTPTQQERVRVVVEK